MLSLFSKRQLILSGNVLPNTYTQKCISPATLNPVMLTLKIHHNPKGFLLNKPSPSQKANATGILIYEVPRGSTLVEAEISQYSPRAGVVA